MGTTECNLNFEYMFAMKKRDHEGMYNWKVKKPSPR